MKRLGKISPTKEQLSIVSTNQMGAELIRGSAGSGKTTTAILRLKSLSNMITARKKRLGDEAPVKILLLAFNSTLAGYVRALATDQVFGANSNIEIDTFARWAMKHLSIPYIDEKTPRNRLQQLASTVPGLEPEYVIGEAEYLMGRFEPESIDNYLTTERTGRGAVPRVDRAMRHKLLDNVVKPYISYLGNNKLLDWNTLAISMRRQITSLNYDIIVVDESQDFSANQIRTINYHLAPEHSLTFVIDTAQRIYARGFTWAEAGVNVKPNRSHRLKENHRNTKQIAAFAAGILEGIDIDNDGVMPDLDSAQVNGLLPFVLTGTYSQQLDWAMQYINQNVDLNNETVGFLKPQGGRWFDDIKFRMRSSNIGLVDLQRNADWPEGHENVAISTFHSSKGLEFDHVIILGFNQENTSFGDAKTSDKILVLRRLFAMAVARAKKQVVIGFKLDERSKLTSHFANGTYRLIKL